jgi:hypothetical protein
MLKNNSSTLVTDINLWNWSFVSSKNKKWSDDRLWSSACISWQLILWRHLACDLNIHCLKNFRYYSSFTCGRLCFKIPNRQGTLIEDLRGFPQFLQASVGILPQSILWLLSPHFLYCSFFTNVNNTRRYIRRITDRAFK